MLREVSCNIYLETKDPVARWIGFISERSPDLIGFVSREIGAPLVLNGTWELQSLCQQREALTTGLEAT